MFLHCTLAAEWLWARRLGRMVAKDCAITCRCWFESWMSMAIAPIVEAMVVM